MRGKTLLFVLLIFLVFCYSSSVIGQFMGGSWRQIPTGTTDQINGAFTSTPGLITIVTNTGNAMHSNDGGQTWHQNQLVPGQSLNSIAGFYGPLNPQTPTVAVGDNGSKWKSSDGGQTWVRDDFSISNNIFDITVDPNPSDPNNVDFWASGQNGTVFHSGNSGGSWQQQSVTYESGDLYGIAFGSASQGVAVGNWWLIYNTTNGGSQWNYQYSPMNNVDFLGVGMGSSTHGWVVGTNGTIIHTTNGGGQWTPQMSGTTNTLNDVLFNGTNNGWVVGNNGTLLQTNNGGLDWSSVSINFNGDFTSISIDNEGNTYVTGSNGALFTNAPPYQPPSLIDVDKDQLNFGVSTINDPPQNMVPLDGQRVYVNSVNDVPQDWTLNNSDDWLNTTPSSGSTPGYIDVNIDRAGLSLGTHSGTVSVIPDGSPQSPINITVYVSVSAVNDPPFGSFDTPLDGSSVSSSIPVTGWALDDVGVDNVKIYRQDGGSQVYIGDAVFVEGARPDIETAYPHYPNNYKAGWGYMMLTNFLPNGGNGTFIITAVAKDVNGETTPLGTKTITCDNANAVKPFGAIDAPQAGGTASGSSYRNWGWVLTPQPNSIPLSGTTIDVYVDGIKVGNPRYNVYRSDIASLFPGYANSNGAVGYFDFNTTAYENGVHTIYWTATDNVGNTDGIGSRYFNISNSNRNVMDDIEGTPFIILNSSGPIINIEEKELNFGAKLGGSYMASVKSHYSEIYQTNTGTPHTQIIQIDNTGGSALSWEAEADQNWISLDPTTGTAPDWLAVIVDPTGLAAGTYMGTVTISDANEGCPPYYLTVNLNVYSDTEVPIGEFNYPDADRTVAGTINISGWALDDIGVESVKVYRQEGNDMVLIGDANFVRGARPDIAHAYSMYPFNNYAGWILSFTTNTLADGDYYFQAEATDYEGNTTVLEGNTFTIDNANSVIPFGDIDTPIPGEIISGDAYQISGWALTPLPNTIPTDGSTISVLIDGVSIGSPIYNIYRADIANLFPANNNSNGSGGIFDLNTTNYADGVHTISWSVTDDQGNVNGSLGSREFVIQNNSNITVDVDDEELSIPKEMALLPAYPNPFNPSTTISFKLSRDEKVDIVVFDILGKKVTTLLDGEFKNAGSYKIYWNGKNNHGNTLSTGVYLVMMKAGSFIQSQKLVLLK
ncbi:MAG: hypothetical protein A2V66_05150 [Ignavibacteria bacterium RBG_13_36_8]|nr:MAG: hypothetical protein A2V66_05150 [Ignavibacteria bacterium RBG_13_36_8]